MIIIIIELLLFLLLLHTSCNRDSKIRPLSLSVLTFQGYCTVKGGSNGQSIGSYVSEILLSVGCGGWLLQQHCSPSGYFSTIVAHRATSVPLQPIGLLQYHCSPSGYSSRIVAHRATSVALQPIGLLQQYCSPSGYFSSIVAYRATPVALQPIGRLQQHCSPSGCFSSIVAHRAASVALQPIGLLQQHCSPSGCFSSIVAHRTASVASLQVVVDCMTPQQWQQSLHLGLLAKNTLLYSTWPVLIFSFPPSQAMKRFCKQLLQYKDLSFKISVFLPYQ